VLPGVAIAYLMGANLLMGALAAAVVVALLISLFSRQGTIKEDTAIGIVFAAALALGVALISSVRTYAVDLTHIMFGNVLGVSPTDVWLIAGIGAAVLLTILAFYRQFLVIAFDPVLAATQRLPVERLRMLLLLLIALTIVVSLQTVGVGLVAAMLVTPGATAYLLTRRLPTMMMVAALIGAVASISGLYLSYYVNIASGAAVVLVATALFTAVFLFAPERGVVWRRG
jgi:ABC-type Mn2+/Zn2+ transport system permease subunit